MKTKSSVVMDRVLMTMLVATASLLWISCGSKGEDPWGMPQPRMSGITPMVGQYVFDQWGDFSVIQKYGDQLYVRFSSDGHRYDEIRITNGTFQWWHGAIGGTHCPTDSYAISGSFITDTRAEGTIKYAYDCQIIGSYQFVATIEAAEPTRTPTLTATPITTPTETPTSWMKVSLPPEAQLRPWFPRKLVGINGIFFMEASCGALECASHSSLYRTMNLGREWERRPLTCDDNAGCSLYDLEVDEGDLYVAGFDHGLGGFVWTSSDLGETFSWDHIGGWDPVAVINVRKGVAWAYVQNYGYFSGTWRKLPGSNWEYLPDLDYAHPDPIDPLNIAYTGSSVTLDGGVTWTPLRGLPAIIDGERLLYNVYEYSRDFGQTWQPLGIEDVYGIVEDKESQQLYVWTQAGELYRGSPEKWQALPALQLQNRRIFQIAISGSYLLALTSEPDEDNHELFLLPLPVQPSMSTPTITATSTSSPTSIVKPTHTSTLTPSHTPTITALPTPTNTPSLTVAHTATSTPTTTWTRTLTPTRTWTHSPTLTGTPTITPTRTLTPSPTPSRTATQTPTRTATSTPTVTTTPTRTATWTPSVTPTETPTPIVQVEAINLSSETLCAENDNVNIPFVGRVTSFDIVATHPQYQFEINDCAPDFTSCINSGPKPFGPFVPLGIEYVSGTRVIRAVRKDFWWQPVGMEVIVDEYAPLPDIHYIVIHQKIAGVSSWPEVLVLYQDGNLRLKPHKQIGGPDPCFSSSVITGSAAMAERPIAAITSIRYLSLTGKIYIEYVNGGSAIVSLEVDRNQAVATVAVNYATDTLPFTTFRSMFVTDGNADVDHVEWVEWIDSAGVVHDDPILDFQGGAGMRWFFHRETVSGHNTSAPDISIIPHQD